MSKKYKNHKNKNLKRILILLFIIIIISSISLVLKNIYTNEKLKNERIADYKEAAEYSKEYLKDRVIPQHIYDFSVEYSGKIDRNEMYKQLYAISRFLPDMCSDLKDSSVKTYYSKYSENIKNYLGIEDMDEFSELVDYLNENDISNLNFEYCVYQKGSLIENQKYSNIKMDFKYENHDAITLNIGVANNKILNQPVLKILFETEE